MENATISRLRNSLSEYLARVRRGETIIVFDRDKPIARIEPIASMDEFPEWAREAVRRGILTPPRTRDRRRITLPPIKTRKPARVLEALLEERRTGR